MLLGESTAETRLIPSDLLIDVGASPEDTKRKKTRRDDESGAGAGTGTGSTLSNPTAKVGESSKSKETASNKKRGRTSTALPPVKPGLNDDRSVLTALDLTFVDFLYEHGMVVYLADELKEVKMELVSILQFGRPSGHLQSPEKADFDQGQQQVAFYRRRTRHRQYRCHRSVQSVRQDRRAGPIQEGMAGKGGRGKGAIHDRGCGVVGHLYTAGPRMCSGQVQILVVGDAVYWWSAVVILGISVFSCTVLFRNVPLLCCQVLIHVLSPIQAQYHRHRQLLQTQVHATHHRLAISWPEVSLSPQTVGLDLGFDLR